MIRLLPTAMLLLLLVGNPCTQTRAQAADASSGLSTGSPADVPTAQDEPPAAPVPPLPPPAPAPPPPPAPAPAQQAAPPQSPVSPVPAARPPATGRAARPAVATAAATPVAAAAPGSAAAQAQQTLDILKDDKKRAALVATLETIAKAQPAAAIQAGDLHIPLEPGGIAAQLLGAGGAFAEHFTTQSAAVLGALRRAPDLLRGFGEIASDPGQRDQLLNAIWRLAALMGCGIAVELALIRLLRRPQHRLRGFAPGGAEGPPVELEAAPQPSEDPADHELDSAFEPPHRLRATAFTLLRRLPFAFGRLVLDLLPVVGFLFTAHLLLAGPLGGGEPLRLVVMVVADSYATCRALLCIARMMLSPDSARLRLIRLSDSAAAYLMRWFRRLVAVAVIGYALAAAGLLLGLSQDAHEAMLKLVGLAVHAMLIVMVLQTRRSVARRLRAPKRSRGMFAALRNHMARVWHWIALFYLVAIWLVWAVELPNGFGRLLHFALVTSLVMLAGRLVLIVVLGLLDSRLPRTTPDVAGVGPDVEVRAPGHRAVLRPILIFVVWMAILLALTEVWGFGTLAWLLFSTSGRSILGSLASITLTVGIGLIVWEAANAAVRRHLDHLAHEQQLARSARLRTLLPLLRTVLLVALLIIVGLMVLSDLGLNIAPLLAGAGVLGIAIGFGSQKLVQDVITGLFLLIENAVQVGDVVSVASLGGVVEHLSIRSIRLRDEDGSVHVIPFSSVSTVTNKTRDFSYAVIVASVAYKDDYDDVTEVLRGIVREMREEPRWAGEIRDDIEIQGLDKFEDSAISIKARIRCGPFARWAVLREFNRRMKLHFDEHGIELPSPRQTLVVNQPFPPARPAAGSAAADDGAVRSAAQ